MLLGLLCFEPIVNLLGSLSIDRVPSHARAQCPLVRPLFGASNVALCTSPNPSIVGI